MSARGLLPIVVHPPTDSSGRFILDTDWLVVVMSSISHSALECIVQHEYTTDRPFCIQRPKSSDMTQLLAQSLCHTHTYVCILYVLYVLDLHVVLKFCMFVCLFLICLDTVFFCSTQTMLSLATQTQGHTSVSTSLPPS